MASTIKTSDFKNGTKLILDQAPCSIINFEHVQPGKGQAFVRVNYRNLLTGRTLEKTFKSGETMEAAEVMEVELQYLYTDSEFWHFMDGQTYEQHSADSKVMEGVTKWLIEQAVCVVILWNEQIISVTPPNFIEVEVAQSDPGLKGDTASGGSKPATLSTGATIQVPLFIEQGEFIRVDTRNGTYVSRVKK